GSEYRYFAHELALPAAAGAFLGHLFPVWLGFKGGKGVATYIGLLLALAWPAAIAFCLIWLAVAALTRYSSLAALVASAATPFALWLIGDRPETVLFTLLTLLLWIMHHANIARLLNGTEGKIGASSGACRFAPRTAWNGAPVIWSDARVLEIDPFTRRASALCSPCWVERTFSFRSRATTGRTLMIKRRNKRTSAAAPRRSRSRRSRQTRGSQPEHK